MSAGSSPFEHRPPPPQRPSYAELLERLHRAPDAFLDESLAPEVDRDLLQALVRRELPEADARLVYRLIHSFQSWNEAHTQVLIEEFRRPHAK